LKEGVYKTIEEQSSEVIFKDRGSKFFGYAFPLQREDDVKRYIQQLKGVHFKARHFCYAWRIGVKENEITYRVNDDGEPNNSAGQPIYGQLLSKEVTNVLVVVVRYFGGTKLGVGGLVNAYKNTAELSLSASKIVQKTIDVHFVLNFEYQHMNSVMRIVKEQNLTIRSQKMELDCEIELLVQKNMAKKVATIFSDLRCLKVKQL